MQRGQRLITIPPGTTGWTFTKEGTVMIQFEFDTFGIMIDERGQQCEVFVLGDIVQMDVSDISDV